MAGPLLPRNPAPTAPAFHSTLPGSPASVGNPARHCASLPASTGVLAAPQRTPPPALSRDECAAIARQRRSTFRDRATSQKNDVWQCIRGIRKAVQRNRPLFDRLHNARLL